METKFSKLEEKDQYLITLLFAALKLIDENEQITEAINDTIDRDTLADVLKGVMLRVIGERVYTVEDHAKFMVEIINDLYTKVE